MRRESAASRDQVVAGLTEKFEILSRDVANLRNANVELRARPIRNPLLSIEPLDNSPSLQAAMLRRALLELAITREEKELGRALSERELAALKEKVAQNPHSRPDETS